MSAQRDAAERRAYDDQWEEPTSPERILSCSEAAEYALEITRLRRLVAEHETEICGLRAQLWRLHWERDDDGGSPTR